MATHTNYSLAKQEHRLSGGFLYDFSDSAGAFYCVTDDSPGEFRDFGSCREAIGYTLRLAQADYDETKIVKH